MNRPIRHLRIPRSRGLRRRMRARKTPRTLKLKRLRAGRSPQPVILRLSLPPVRTNTPKGRAVRTSGPKINSLRSKTRLSSPKASRLAASRAAHLRVPGRRPMPLRTSRRARLRLASRSLHRASRRGRGNSLPNPRRRVRRTSLTVRSRLMVPRRSRMVTRLRMQRLRRPKNPLSPMPRNLMPRNLMPRRLRLKRPKRSPPSRVLRTISRRPRTLRSRAVPSPPLVRTGRTVSRQPTIRAVRLLRSRTLKGLALRRKHRSRMLQG